MPKDTSESGDVAAKQALLERVNACPFYRLLGFEVVEAADGMAEVRLPFREELLQFQGAVHGGAVYSIADAAVAVALLTLAADEGEDAVTIEGKMNYLAPVTKGSLVAKARIVHRGRRIALGDAEVYREDGRLCGKGLMTYTLIRTNPKPELAV